tara:strand:- start:213 stop:446 length:234 start_codon:yes stop_codon:yes gene_type:complete
MILISINRPNWIALLQPYYYNGELQLLLCQKSYLTREKFLVMLAINKITAAKLIILWNLPTLLLSISAFEVGTTLFA